MTLALSISYFVPGVSQLRPRVEPITSPLCTRTFREFIVPLYNVYLEAVDRREYTFPVPWSAYISQHPGRSRYSVSSLIDIRTSSPPRCLLGGRRRWAPMPEAVEPGAWGPFFDGHGGAGG